MEKIKKKCSNKQKKIFFLYPPLPFHYHKLVQMK